MLQHQFKRSGEIISASIQADSVPEAVIDLMRMAYNPKSRRRKFDLTLLNHLHSFDEVASDKRTVPRADAISGLKEYLQRASEEDKELVDCFKREQKLPDDFGL